MASAFPFRVLHSSLIASATSLPVVSRKDASKLLGIITLHDIAEAMSKEDDAGSAANDDRA
jgi:CBS domain-containing protein